MNNEDQKELMLERDQVIVERFKAFTRWGNDESQKDRIYREFIQPLNQRLISLNRALGL